MSLTQLPERWRPNAIYKLGDRVMLRGERELFVLRCEKGGRGGMRPPRIPENLDNLVQIAKHEHSTAIVKLYDAECEWWLERVIPKRLAHKR